MPAQNPGTLSIKVKVEGLQELNQLKEALAAVASSMTAIAKQAGESVKSMVRDQRDEIVDMLNSIQKSMIRAESQAMITTLTREGGIKLAQATQAVANAHIQAAASGEKWTDVLIKEAQAVGLTEKQMRRLVQTSQEATRRQQDNITTIGRSGQFGGLLSVGGAFMGMVPGAPQGIIMAAQRMGFGIALARSTGGWVGQHALAIGTGAAIIGVAASIISTATIKAIELEESFIRISLAAGKSAGGVDRVTSSIHGLVSALRGRYSVEEVADAVQQLVKSGISFQEAMDGAAQTALRFARVAQVDVSTAVTQLVTLSSQYNRSMKEMADIIVRTADLTSASIQQITDAFVESASAAESFGLEIEELSAMITILDRMGKRGSEAATAFRAMIVGMSELKGGTLSEPQRRVIAELGLSREVFMLQAGYITLIEFIKALRDAGPTMAQLITLFDRRGEPAISAIMKMIDDMPQIIEDMGKTTTDSLKKYAKELEDSTKSKIESLRNLWNNFLAQIGRAILNLLNSIILFFSPGERARIRFHKNLGEMQKWMVENELSPEKITGIDWIIFMGEEMAKLLAMTKNLPFGEEGEELRTEVMAALGELLETARQTGRSKEFMRVLQLVIDWLKEDQKRTEEDIAWFKEQGAKIPSTLLESSQRINKLLDIFGSILTEEQKRILEETQKAAEKKPVPPSLGQVIDSVVKSIGIGLSTSITAVFNSPTVSGVVDLVNTVINTMKNEIARTMKTKFREHLTGDEGYKTFIKPILDFIYGKEVPGKPTAGLLGKLLESIGIDREKAGETLEEFLASVLASVFVDMGNLIVSVIAKGLMLFIETISGKGRGRSPMWGAVYGAHMRTGQGISPSGRTYSPTFAPAVHIGSINVNGKPTGRDHDALATAIYAQIQRAALMAVNSATSTLAFAAEGIEDF